MYSILNEQIYRRPETDMIDKEFKVILDYCNKLDDHELKKTDLNKLFASQLKNIENLILKLFNAKIILKFDEDSNPKVLDYGMFIMPSVQEMHGKLKNAIERKDKGFYLRECTNALVCIDLGFISLIRDYRLNERHLTATLLHELGHKIYVKTQEEYDSMFSVQKVCIKAFGISVIIPIYLCKFILSFLLLVGLFGLYQFKSVKNYTEVEHTSDLVALKYGYSIEMYQILNIFYDLSSVSMSKKFKALNNLCNMLNDSKIRRDKLEKALKNELNDNKNSLYEKNVIKSALKEIKNIKKGY